MKNNSKILIVVDYQKDFVNGSLGFKEALKLDHKIANKIEDYLYTDECVIFTFDTHKNGYLNTNEGRHLPVRHCIENTPGWELFGNVGEIYKRIFNKPNIKTIFKPTFGSLKLADYLWDLAHSREIAEDCEIEIVGVVTNICVISNAIMCKSALPEAKITINSALCASNDEKLEQEAFDIMRNLHMDVI